MTIKKRGRPIGLNKNPIAIDDFAQTLQEWDELDKQVNWEEVAKKQETELKVLRDENDELARICVNRFEKINDYMKLVKYLEGRIEDLTIRGR
jgi:hypothetical protein